MRPETLAFGEAAPRQPPRPLPFTQIDVALMLRGLRKASSNWLGKVVMAAVVGFLIISFGIWGIGDIFRGFSGSAVAKVGRSELSAKEFSARYNERLQQIGRQLGRPITPSLAQAFGIEQQVLGQFIS